jgi:SAM-dependent methyltransferase
MDLKELESGVNPDIHWYYQSKKLPLFSYTRKLLKTTSRLTLVDVGSGSGFFAYSLEKELPDGVTKVYLVDIGYTAEEIAETKGKKIEKTHRIPDRIENGLVILMDVLEHLEDDFKMLKEIKAACVGDNNHFFITVPAFESLWSGHDDYLGHYRRYKIATLRAVLDKAGYTTHNSYYLYGGLFPMVWAARKLSNMRKKEATSNMKPFNPLVNKILLGLTSAEMSIAPANKVFGVTCVAQGKI